MTAFCAVARMAKPGARSDVSLRAHHAIPLRPSRWHGMRLADGFFFGNWRPKQRQIHCSRTMVKHPGRAAGRTTQPEFRVTLQPFP